MLFEAAHSDLLGIVVVPQLLVIWVTENSKWIHKLKCKIEVMTMIMAMKMKMEMMKLMEMMNMMKMMC